jgi:hypothetical protein
MKMRASFGPWLVEYTPEDGARIDRLAYGGVDLMTTAPQSFRAPAADLGEYETRPVFGYDDCFPSVGRSPFPGIDWEVPDHGEVCWLPWEHRETPVGLAFSAASKAVPLTLERRMSFTDSALTWEFEVVNKGHDSLPFQHVMHPLMPLSRITGFALPAFAGVVDRGAEATLPLSTSANVERFLLSRPKGTATMLFVTGVKDGSMAWTYAGGLTVEVVFPAKLFPSIGIWWNNTGYPNEEGLRRDECAFEPIPGNTGLLSEAVRDGLNLRVDAGRRVSWRIVWEVRR